VKTSPPHTAARTVERPAVAATLDALTRDHRVVLVSAPAGYGKTTALGAWASKEPRPVAWVTLDAFDNDPSRLFGQLLESLRGALRDPVDPARSVRGAEALAEVVPPGTGGRLEQSHVDALLVGLEAVATEVVVVLDDLHALHAASVRGFLTSVVRYAPANVRLVLASRYDPPLPLQRLRAAGELGLLRQDDLAFSPDDLALLALDAGLPLDDEALGELAVLTGGWPVAVRLAILALLDGPEPVSRLRSMLASELPLADYLLEEVLGGLEPDLRAFVLDATVSEQLDAELAVVLHGPDGPALLERCVRAGLFLSSYERTGRSTYSWHSLFSAQCQAILQRSDPPRWAQVRLRAAEAIAQWDLASAVALAGEAGDDALAARLLRSGWTDLFVAGETETLLALLDRITGPARGAADVVLVEAACRAVDEDPAAERLLGLARERRDALDEGRRAAFDVTETLVSLYVARSGGGLQATVERGRELLVAAEVLGPSTRALAFYLVGRAESRLAYDDASPLEHLRAGARSAVEGGFPAIEVACLAESTVTMVGRGDVDEAEHLARDLLARTERMGWADTSAVAPAYLALGMVAYAHDRYDDARAVLRQAIALTTQRHRVVGFRASTVLMVTCLAAGDAAGLLYAREVARERSAELEVSPMVADLVRVIDALALDDAGERDRAVALLRSLGVGPRLPLGRIWEAEVYRRAGLLEEARGALGRVSDEQRRAEVSVAFELTSALLCADAGDTTGAHEHLEAALADAHARGIRRPFTERGPDLPGLLSAHLMWGTRHEVLVAELLRADCAHTPTHRTASYWELTDRELDVLTYLRTPMTASRIAEAMFVSVNTVKTHQRAIYRKLGATGRRDAVRVAFERGLIRA
jgi:LuxR family maltose regulon positive regulatory protein